MGLHIRRNRSGDDERGGIPKAAKRTNEKRERILVTCMCTKLEGVSSRLDPFLAALLCDSCVHTMRNYYTSSGRRCIFHSAMEPRPW